METSVLKNRTKHTGIRLSASLLFMLIVFGFVSCNPARHLEDGKYLLRSNKIKIEGKKHILDIDELENYIKQKPNTRIMGVFPFHLRTYNFLAHGKERKWKNKLKKVVGEEPVVYDEFLTKKSARQLELYAHSKGYYDAEVHDTVRLSRKKAWVKYTIVPNKPYRIRQVSFSTSDSVIGDFVLKDTTDNTVLHPGGILDYDALVLERDRISKMIRNRGYYAFSKDFIDFEVDSGLQSKLADVNLRIKLFPKHDQYRGIILNQHSKYKIRDVNLYLNIKRQSSKFDSLQVFAPPDTLTFNNTHFYYYDNMVLKPDVLFAKIDFRQGQYFSETTIDKTYRQLSGLQQFKLINIKFEELPDSLSSDSARLLDCHIQLTTIISQGYQVELEGTNSSNHWGIGGNLLYYHKNLFGGAEIFNMKFSGALEVQREFVSNTADNFLPNTFEYGVETSMTIPKFWIPFKAGRMLRKYQPKTALSFSYSHQKRTNYTRKIINAGFGYQWNSSQFKKHRFNPIELNIINLTDTSAEFSQYFDTLYLKHSYEAQFISVSSYTFELSTQDLKRQFSDFIFLRSRTELAGNIISGLNELLGVNKTADGYYELFNTRFAQFVRGDIDLRYYKHLNEHSLLVYRGFFGIGIPYGNNHVLPFVKKYFSGGSNGIRAWQIRSLGPGSFVDDSSFPDLAADMKIEANLEYRFDVAWKLKGAFFIDAGNIWAINRYDERPGALFTFHSFYKEMAIGTGLGARFDFDFLLFRIDLGIKVRDPELPEGSRMIWGNRKLGIGDYSWNFGIGYPF